MAPLQLMMCRIIPDEWLCCFEIPQRQNHGCIAESDWQVGDSNNFTDKK